MNDAFEYDIHERAGNYFAPAACVRCEAKYDLSQVLTYEGAWERLCDDCAAADAQLETAAEAIINRPGCQEREAITDASTGGTQQLVAALNAHDAGCNCTARKPLAIETTTTETRAA